jgi:cholesterol oxidase
MRYRIFLNDDDGQPVTLVGVKNVNDDEGIDLWHDTTTLYVTLFEGQVEEADEADAVVRGAGVIRIEPLDFMAQMTTFRTEGGPLTTQAAILARFGLLFMGKLWDVYGPRTV